jgi:TolB-like protein
MIFNSKIITPFFPLYMVLIFLCAGLLYSESPELSRTMAVLDIRSNCLTKEDVYVVSDRLSTELFRTKRFTILERSQIDQILKEQGFQQAGCVNDQCAVEAGQLLGVQLIVLGRVDKIGTMFSVNLRIIDVATGKMINAVTEDCRGCSIESVILNTLPNAARSAAGLSTEPGNIISHDAIPSPPVSSPSEMEDMVRIAIGNRSFLMDRTEVTQKAYQAVMGDNPSSNHGCSDCPVENITWSEADTYCKSIGKRLPNLDEWDFAARGSDYGNYLSNPKTYGWFRSNANSKTHPVATASPNSRGIYDMFGNVYEWTADKEKPAQTGVGRLFKAVAGGKNDRVRKGGSYRSSPPVPIDHLLSNGESYKADDIGFRCAK